MSTVRIVRCYQVRDRVAGFGEQLINALYPTAPGVAPPDAPQPGPRLYYPPTRPDFQKLKNRLEGKWLPEMCGVLSIDPAELPVIWDADFMYGPKDEAGEDTYVLCEINISSVYAFPDEGAHPTRRGNITACARPSAIVSDRRGLTDAPGERPADKPGNNPRPATLWNYGGHSVSSFYPGAGASKCAANGKSST